MNCVSLSKYFHKDNEVLPIMNVVHISLQAFFLTLQNVLS